MEKNKINIILRNIKKRFLNDRLLSKAIPIILSVWILSLTAYYCFNTPWLSLFSGWQKEGLRFMEKYDFFVCPYCKEQALT